MEPLALSEIEDRLLDVNTNDGSVDINGNPVSKHHTGTWRACYFILCIDFCEHLAFIAISRNLITYLTKELSETNLDAARQVSLWGGTCFLTPLLGAFFSDSYWGNYPTILIFGAIYFIGITTLTLCTFIPNEYDSIGNNSTKSIVLFFALYIIALGYGGLRPCVSTFGASQFDETDPKERTQKGSFFDWYFFLTKISSLLSSTLIAWLLDKYGWGLGLTIPTILIGLSFVSFKAGSRIYRFRNNPAESPLTRICRVIVAAVRKSNSNLPSDSSLLYEEEKDSSINKGSRNLQHSSDLRFLDKAAIISSSDISCTERINPWRVCTITQVEEIKILIRMLPIMVTVMINSIFHMQITTTFVEQGMAMKNSIGTFDIPPASLSTFESVTVLVGIPLYDTCFIPIARKFTGNDKGLSQLQRMSVGLLLSTLSMVSAALVESRRLEIAKEYGLIHQKVKVPMSIIWLAPQYILFGASEVFSFVGQIEFFYDQAPDSMRSTCLAFWQLMISFGNYFASFLLTIISLATTRDDEPGWIPSNLNEGHLDRYFWLLAALSSSNVMLFLCCAVRYKSKRVY